MSETATDTITAEDVAEALGVSCRQCDKLIDPRCPKCGRDWHELIRACDWWATHHYSLIPPYLEDSPEGYGAAREIELAIKAHGWWWELRPQYVEHWGIVNAIHIHDRETGNTFAIVPYTAFPETLATAYVRAVRGGQ